jgi:hypothetical protein
VGSQFGAARERWFAAVFLTGGRTGPDARSDQRALLGNVEERAGSEHQWQRHQGSGNIHRRTVSSRRLRGELGPLEDDPRPNAKRCNRTA